MRFEGLRRVLRELTGRSNADFTDDLEAQLEACLEGARLAHRCALGEVGAGEALTEMIDIEHRGDRRRAELVEALAQAIVTPIDREDLFRVSRSIDDVLDNLRDFVREVELFGEPAASGPFGGVTEAIIEAVIELQKAVAHLAGSPDHVIDASLAAKKRGNQIRHLYEQAMARLLADDEARRGETIHSVLRTRELLRRLDVVGLRLGEAADALSDGMMKRSF